MTMLAAKKYNGDKLRIGRTSETNRAYLVTTVTYRREPIFNDLNMGRVLVQSMQHLHEKQKVNSLAYVVMPDHIHWLFTLHHNKSLYALMNVFKGYTSLMINRHRNFSGVPVWQRGYHEHAVRNEEDIKSVARYVIANPLRAGLVESVGDYPLWDATWL